MENSKRGNSPTDKDHVTQVSKVCSLELCSLRLFEEPSCNTKPQRGVTMVASRFNGWYKAARKKRAFRYATSNLATIV